MRLEIDEVGVRIGDAVLLDAVSLAPRPGRVTGVLGPNGCGKTTLLSVVSGVRRPTSGQVRLDGEDLHALSGRRRARTLALLEQEASTTLPLTAREVVATGRIPHRSLLAPTDKEGGEVVRAALATVDATQLTDRLWTSLSGGERQRVHLARALAQEPSVLLLDEPTNHLDLAHQLTFLERVRELGLTTLVSLHDLNLAAAFCDDVVVLRAGQVRALGPVEEVLTADLVREVYDVEVTVEPHPRREHPVIRWDGPVTA